MPHQDSIPKIPKDRMSVKLYQLSEILLLKNRTFIGSAEINKKLQNEVSAIKKQQNINI